jgi:hypothetical protein
MTVMTLLDDPGDALSAVSVCRLPSQRYSSWLIYLQRSGCNSRDDKHESVNGLEFKELCMQVEVKSLKIKSIVSISQALPFCSSLNHGIAPLPNNGPSCRRLKKFRLCCVHERHCSCLQ